MDQEFKEYMCYKAEGNTAINLFYPHVIGKNGQIYQTIKSLKMCNTHATDSVNVDLYLIDTFTTDEVYGMTGPPTGSDINYYLLKAVTIPLGVTLFLSNEDIDYDFDKYILAIKLSAADSVVDLTFINRI